MKLESSSAAVDVKTNMQMTTIKAELAQDKLHKMWDLLQSPYRDPIASLIREYVSNCFDSHIEAGVNTPVYVTLEEDQSSWYWACEDFGVGLSPDRCKNVFMKYLNSTKEETNNQIGAFGMGSKSGLGYTDVVHIRTRFNGTEYKYMLHKTTDAPTLALVDSCPTDKRNGTQIKIYLKDNWDERDKFERRTKQQLTYFDNIHYAGSLKDMNEDFVVYKGKNFWVKPTCILDGMHLVIGKVAYPINWENIGLEKVDLDIALSFDIGDLPVIFTREDIRYTDEAVRKIKNKIAAAQLEIIQLATPENKEIHSLYEYRTLISGRAQVTFSDDHTMVLPENLSDQIDLTGVDYFPNPYINKKCLEKSYNNQNKDSIDDLFSRILINQRRLHNGRNLARNWYNFSDRFRKTSSSLNKHYTRILMDEPSDPRKNRFIANTFGNYADLFTDNRENLKLDDYKYSLKLRKDNRETWRHQIQWFQKWADDNFELFFDHRYSEIEVPEEFEKSAKVGATRVVVGSDEIRYKAYRETENNSFRTGGVEVTADLIKSKVSDLTNKPSIIWSTRDNEDGLKCTYRLLENLKNMKSITLISVSKKDVGVMELLEEEHAHIKSLDNWYLSENETLECFVFFNKFRRLVSLFIESSVFRKPKNIPYIFFANRCNNYNDKLPEEFGEHLLKIFKLQGKKLEMDKFPALVSWYKAENALESMCKKMKISCTDAKVVIANRMFPNRPVENRYSKLKSYLLINNL
tara:strand:- start:4302 stop:6536 length:2235 start_codon:yes stop_codon:yes gene_type:complete